jgi:hypothetical protein
MEETPPGSLDRESMSAMTTTVVDSTEHHADEHSSRRRRGVVAALLSVALVVVLAVAHLVWTWQASETARDISVGAGPGMVRCDAGRATSKPAGEDVAPGTVVRIQARPGTSCRVPVTVRNDGPHTVTLRDLVFPATHLDSDGNHGALVVTGRSGGTATGEPDSNDAVLDVDEEIAPGEAWSDVVTIETNPHGCVSAGDWWVIGPQARLGALHRERVVEGTIVLLAHLTGRGLKSAGCA